MRSTYTAAVLITVLSLGLAACGDDGDEATSETTGDPTTTTEAGLGSDACDAVLGVGEALNSGPEGPPTTEYLEDQLLPAVDAVVAADADELAEPAAELQTAVQAAIEGEQLDEDVVFGLYGDLAAGVHTGCGYQSVDVTAVDYAFVDLPATLSPGQSSFSLANDGEEPHEMILFRRADGETRPIEDILALGEEEAGDAIVFTGATFAEPGETGYLATELEAGGYATVCFIPVGGGEEGPPHFTEGMVSEFEVS